MREYVMTVLGVSLAAAAVGMLAPEGAGGGVKKHIKLLVSLAVICAVIRPVVGFTAAFDLTALLPDNEDVGAENYYYNVLTGLGKGELEARLTELISQEFPLTEGGVAVTVEARAENGSFVADRVLVTLSGRAVFADPYKIEAYVTDLVGCDCDTVC